jgi:WD40 repeat protein
MSSQFLGWKFDSQKVLVKGITPSWQAAEVDITSGAFTVLEFPKLRGNSLTISALAYSPDGKYLADALAFPPIPKEGKEALLNIGLWDTATWERKTIQEIPFGESVAENSLVWSGDGKFLAWMATQRASASSPSNDRRSDLWVYNLSTGVGRAIRSAAGHFGNRNIAAWSPDGKKLALVLFDTNVPNDLSGNINLIDWVSGADTQVSRFKQRMVNFLQWSSDGRWIYCNVADKISGAIVAVRVSDAVAIPVAGPVPSISPFWLAP